MKRIRFSVTYPDRLVHPFHRRIIDGGPLSRAELLMWSPTADATTLFWCDGGKNATAAAVAGIDSLLDTHFVESADGTYAFLRQDSYEFPAVLLDAIAAARVIFLTPVVFLDSGNIRFDAVGESTALSEFHDRLSTHGDLAIELVQEFERQTRSSRITDRQDSALEAAVSVGYYEVPRDGTIADIAAVLDCSTSTAGELVRKAEASVIRGYVGTTGDQ
ncbi:helix-turn-helix domain-containing protein [Halobaculum halobium]|uniref:Helix-turn-helix domain-containing protein n=1 Tax=Halobaculum halobium TaxID=3032281 RepID=A0ABD5T655_9EURY|nr:helix-turn-helix domain-containing protein [Halobaculum sp. SYNS20]